MSAKLDYFLVIDVRQIVFLPQVFFLFLDPRLIFVFDRRPHTHYCISGYVARRTSTVHSSRQLHQDVPFRRIRSCWVFGQEKTTEDEHVAMTLTCAAALLHLIVSHMPRYTSCFRNVSILVTRLLNRFVRLCTSGCCATG